MNDPMIIKLKIEKSREKQYIPIPFELPAGIERIDVRYRYPRSELAERGGFIIRSNPCVIDLALEAPGSAFVGASGSDRDHVWVSPLGSSAGFARREIVPGVWRIIAGAYHVPEGGVVVEYEITLTKKERRLFRGDTHLHTSASDGAADMEGTLALARQQKLDYFFVTDHNNFPADNAICPVDDITILPGTEWTHYNGHAGLLGVNRAFDAPYYTADLDETESLFLQAKRNGAMVVLNHPFCPLVPWLWGFDLPYDGIEVWNGVMSERNERAIRYWHARLAAGEKITATGGSDYHRAGLLGGVAMPCMCLYAPSRSAEDLISALRHGSGYLSYLPDGPGADARCANSESVFSFGDTAPADAQTEISFFALQGADELKLITDLGEESVRCPEGTVSIKLTRYFPGARFARFEVYRSYAPGLPPMRAMLTNPIYFER